MGRITRSLKMTALFAPAAVLIPALARAAEEINSGDTAWVLTSSAIVLMMTIPGLALFYGGLVRPKNVLGMIMHCFIAAAVVSVIWVLWGYSIAFGEGNKFFGYLGWFGLRGVGMEANGTIPHLAFMTFQGMFAIITVALITGAFAERMKFSAFLLFMILWSTFIYSPLCHWVWGGGWIGTMGALDFAGGTVVHISSGVSALAAALFIGRRVGFGKDPMPPHNLPFTVLGASLLWVGWFGFNAGSALAANGTAANAFVTTNTATGAAVLGWMFTEWFSRGKPTVLGAASGAVAGLVAITPAAGFVTPAASIIIGVVAGFLCYLAVNAKVKLGYDDSLDVVGIHGVGGTWGAVATGLFALTAVNADGADGLFAAGNADLLVKQFVAIGGTMVFCFLGTVVILFIVKLALGGLRVADEDESAGLDLSQHSETAYTMSGAAAAMHPVGGFSAASRPEPAGFAEPAQSRET